MASPFSSTEIQDRVNTLVAIRTKWAANPAYQRCLDLDIAGLNSLLERQGELNWLLVADALTQLSDGLLIKERDAHMQPGWRDHSEYIRDTDRNRVVRDLLNNFATAIRCGLVK